MKKLLKESKESIILSLALCFMLFIYEPICSYASNIADYHIDIYDLFPYVFLEFILSFFILSTFFILIYKYKKKIYSAIYIILFVLFFCMYVEGSYLCAFLPILDGAPISWNSLIVPFIISTIFWITIIVVTIILCRKYKFKQIKKYTSYVSLFIFVMLLCVSIFFTTRPNFFEDKNYVITTQKNINNISSDKNFIIFVLDSVNSRDFKQELKKLNKESILDGFTYYEDTLGIYPYTKFAVPYILSGSKFEGTGESYQKYYSDGIDNSEFLKRLEKEGYELDIYEREFVYNNENTDRINNISTSVKIDKKEFIKQQIRYTMFRYFPYVLKRFVKIEFFTLNDILVMNNTYERFKDSNLYNYLYFLNKDFDVVENKKFMFYHLEGGHIPFDTDVNMKNREGLTQLDKVDSSITLTDMFLTKLKNSGAYDNSIIIIMADHAWETGTGRQHPILYIKGFNERHDLAFSSKKVSYEDLQETFFSLLDNKKSDELFPNERKERYYYYYDFEVCDLYEKVTTGHAWEQDKLTNTGKVYKCT